jgi:acyl carrier protein
MSPKDRLLPLLVDFFDLPPDTRPENITQQSLVAWDSLATVQLITELEGTFSVEFGIEEIQRLRGYHEIRDALSKKGVLFENSPTLPA